MQQDIIFKNNNIFFIVQDPRILLTYRIINPQNKWDFLFGWNYRYELDDQNKIKTITGFSLKYYYELYKKYCDSQKFGLIRINDSIWYDCRGRLPFYIKREIIRNPEILDCLINYGYEKDKQWIKKIDHHIFEKINRYQERKSKNRIQIITDEQQQSINKKNGKKYIRDKRRKSVRRFPSKSNQEKNIERVKQLRERGGEYIEYNINVYSKAKC